MPWHSCPVKVRRPVQLPPIGGHVSEWAYGSAVIMERQHLVWTENPSSPKPAAEFELVGAQGTANRTRVLSLPASHSLEVGSMRSGTDRYGTNENRSDSDSDSTLLSCPRRRKTPRWSGAASQGTDRKVQRNSRRPQAARPEHYPCRNSSSPSGAIPPTRPGPSHCSATPSASTLSYLSQTPC